MPRVALANDRIQARAIIRVFLMALSGEMFLPSDPTLGDLKRSILGLP